MGGWSEAAEAQASWATAKSPTFSSLCFKPQAEKRRLLLRRQLLRELLLEAQASWAALLRAERAARVQLGEGPPLGATGSEAEGAEGVADGALEAGGGWALALPGRVRRGGGCFAEWVGGWVGRRWARRVARGGVAEAGSEGALMGTLSWERGKLRVQVVMGGGCVIHDSWARLPLGGAGCYGCALAPHAPAALRCAALRRAASCCAALRRAALRPVARWGSRARHHLGVALNNQLPPLRCAACYGPQGWSPRQRTRGWRSAHSRSARASWQHAPTWQGGRSPGGWLRSTGLLAMGPRVWQQQQQ